MKPHKPRGCCALLHLREDNARFILHFIVMIIYALFGAGVFMILERANEVKERNSFYDFYNKFLRDFRCLENNSSSNNNNNSYSFNYTKSRLDDLLRRYSRADTMGILKERRPRWDFPGSFYFVGTVVSTIGFGMTTPQTTSGKIFLILYGFLGCSGGILFFNLFLERIITFIAYILRAIHQFEQRRKGGQLRRGSAISDSTDSLDNWKPSVNWVQLILFLSACLVACCASAMYKPMEEWGYFESIYFCFVAFATIGFGDYVVSQKRQYANQHFYRFGNFVFLVIGCCCIYSLFNVTSIVIKQVLNYMIKKLDCQDCWCIVKRRMRKRSRRNAITPNNLRNAANAGGNEEDGGVDATTEAVNNSLALSELSRHGSNEMISRKDFFQGNKISLAMMQKQLAESANNRNYFINKSSNGGVFQGGVGPLAILNKKLGQEDV